MRKSIVFLLVCLISLLTAPVCQAAPRVTTEQEESNPSQLTDSVGKKTQDIIRLNVGPGWIVSEIEAWEGVYKRKMGFSASADYQHFWGIGLGLGVNYMFHNSSFDGGLDMNIHYLGPSLVYGMDFGGKWRWDVSTGIGIAYYNESSSGSYKGDSQFRFARTAQIGLEGKLSDRVGIGIQVNGFIVSLKEPEGYKNDKYDFYGIKRYDVLVGVRIHI